MSRCKETRGGGGRGGGGGGAAGREKGREGGGCAVLPEQSVLTPARCLTSLETSGGASFISSSETASPLPRQQEKIPHSTLIHLSCSDCNASNLSRRQMTRRLIALLSEKYK